MPSGARLLVMIEACDRMIADVERNPPDSPSVRMWLMDVRVVLEDAYARSDSDRCPSCDAPSPDERTCEPCAAYEEHLRVP